MRLAVRTGAIATPRDPEMHGRLCVTGEDGSHIPRGERCVRRGNRGPRDRCGITPAGLARRATADVPVPPVGAVSRAGHLQRLLSTSTSCAPSTASHPSRSSTTATSARACSSRHSAGPGSHQVARGSAAHRRARRGHTTDHTPADRPEGDPCAARRRRRTSSASTSASRASTSEQPSGLLPTRNPS